MGGSEVDIVGVIFGAGVAVVAGAAFGAGVVVVVDVWQAAAAAARTMRSRFMTLSFGNAGLYASRTPAIVAPLPLGEDGR